jgi:hypothetical protein
MAKQEEVSGCDIWRIGQMDIFRGFGSGNFLSRLLAL